MIKGTMTATYRLTILLHLRLLYVWLYLYCIIFVAWLRSSSYIIGCVLYKRKCLSIHQQQRPFSKEFSWKKCTNSDFIIWNKLKLFWGICLTKRFQELLIDFQDKKEWLLWLAANRHETNLSSALENGCPGPPDPLPADNISGDIHLSIYKASLLQSYVIIQICFDGGTFFGHNLCFDGSDFLDRHGLRQWSEETGDILMT